MRNVMIMVFTFVVFSLSPFSATSAYGQQTTVSKYRASAERYPIDIAYNYARCQMLYYGAQLGSYVGDLYDDEIGQNYIPSKITKIRFQRATGDDDTVNNVQIHMAHTHKRDLMSGWVDTSDHQLVFSGNLSIPTGAADTWFEIELTNPFYYDGSSNLIISFRHQDATREATYTTWRTGLFNSNTMGHCGRCVALYSNIENLPATPPPPEYPGYYVNDRLPHIQLGFEPLSGVYLKDGSFVLGEIKIESLKVTTEYGVLNVPKDQVIKIRIGKKADPELKAKIESLIKQLADTEFKVREEATKQLSELGPVALAELREATNSEDVEVQTRAEKLVRQIEQAASGEEEVIDDDEVQAAKFTIRGTVEIESLEVITKDGVLRLPKKHIKSVVVTAESSVTRTLTVDANSCVSGTMMDSKIEVKKGDTLTVTATGTLFIWQTTASPEGDPNSGHISHFPLGALVGKIGSDGPLFKIGASYKGTADRDGKLYLGIAIRRYPNPPPGDFKVKISVERK